MKLITYNKNKKQKKGVRQMKYIDIYKKSLALELKNKGHKIFKTRINLKNPKYEVFVFENSMQFKKDWDDINNR